MRCQAASVVQPQAGKSMQVQSFVRMKNSAANQVKILCEEGLLDSAMNTLMEMDRQGSLPSEDMYCYLLRACGKSKALAQAKRVQALLVKQGLESTRFLGEYLVSTLVTCGGFSDALQVFDRLENRTVFSWTAVISGYTTAGQGEEALTVYVTMRQDGVEPNAYTFVTLLKACGSISSLEQGKCIHAEVYRCGFTSDLFIITALADMYAKCGSILDSRYVFDSLSQRDVVAWTAMLAAYVDQGQPRRALELYEDMLKEGGVSPNSWTFVSVLQACGLLAEKDLIMDELPTEVLPLAKGKAIHAEAWRRSCHSDVFVGSALVSTYGKCGAISDAETAFHGLPLRDVVSWNAMLTAYIEQGCAEKAIDLYGEMRQEGVSPNERSFVSVLQACGMIAEQEVNGSASSRQSTHIKPLQMARCTHAEARIKGLECDVFVSSTLVSVYGKCGSMVDAENVFNNKLVAERRSTVTWNAMLSAYVEQGQPDKALQLYRQLQQTDINPDEVTFVSAIQACDMLAGKEDAVMVDGKKPLKSKYVEEGKSIHDEVRRMGYDDSNVTIGSALVGMYVSCWSLVQAFEVFNRLSERHVGSWNTMIAGLVQQGEAERAVELYTQMKLEGVSPNRQTFVSTLQACGALAVRGDVGKASSCGRWNQSDCLELGKEIHLDIRRNCGHRDLDAVYVGSSLISMYGKCGSTVAARDVFDGLAEKNVVSWNAMLAAYVEQGQANEALDLYEKMQEEGVSAEERTLVAVLQACGRLGEQADSSSPVEGKRMQLKYLEKGKAIHAEARNKGYDSQVFVGNTLISMYGECGSVEHASSAFNRIREKDVISWTALIAAHAQNGDGGRALELYLEMQDSGGLRPTEMTVVCILQGCSDAGGLDCCKQVHCTLVSTGNDLSPLVATTLIHAYGKCGSMADAQAVFEAMQQPDVVAWTAIIAGYARQGCVSAVLRCYKEMRAAGVRPNAITYLSLLSSCSHAGLVEEGVELFESMSTVHGIAPEIEHFVTMVDLFGRAGCFPRIETLLATMEPTVLANMSLWLCLLCACQKHGRVELGELAFRCAVELEPKNPGPYVVMSNIYVDAGYVSRGDELRGMRRRARAWKSPGQTWIEHGREMRPFVAGQRQSKVEEQQRDLLWRVQVALEEDG